MREVAGEAGVSPGQLQHYFSSRAEMLAFAMEFASEQTSRRVSRSLRSLDQPPHPRDVLRVVLTEMLPLRPDSRATSCMNAAYVLEAIDGNMCSTRGRVWNARAGEALCLGSIGPRPTRPQ